MDENKQKYAEFKEKKGELVNIIADTSNIVSDLSMPKFADRLKVMRNQVNSDSFKIQIVGTFKNGKSTFINALLGEDVLPTKPLPCTAVINEVKYGEKKRAVVHFCNPLPKQLLDTIPEGTLKHMQEHGMKDVPPMVIEYDRINEYVVIPTDKSPEEIALASPYSSVELFYPSEYLKDGVEIVDSPGLNESDERTRVTLNYLDRADAIIFLLDANKLCAATEMELIEGILADKGFNDMFFVVNRIDQIPAKDREEIKAFANKNLKEYTTHEIFCVSSLQAVEAKTGIDRDGDELSEEERAKKLQKSGFLPLEQELTRFLVDDKGRLKLARPARELNNIINQEVLYKAIPSHLKMLSTNIETLRQRYDAIKPRLDNLNQQKSELHAQLLTKIANSRNEIRRAIVNYYVQIADKVPVWTKEYQPVHKPGFGSKRKIQECADEINGYLSNKIKDDYASWSKDVMQPLIEEKTNEIFSSSEKDLGTILEAIDSASFDLSGVKSEVKEVKPWERVTGAGVMLLAGSSGAKIMTSGFGSKDMAKNLALDLGVGFGVSLIAFAHPVLAIGMIVALIWKGIGEGKIGNLENVKEGVTKAVVNTISEKARENADTLVDEIAAKLREIADSTVKVLDDQISDVETQVKAVMDQMKQGKDAVNQKTAQIEGYRTQLHKLSERLSAFVFNLVGLAEPVKNTK